MNSEQIVSALKGYQKELKAITSRFVHDRAGIHIDQNDSYRLGGLVMELTDLLRDHVRLSQRHVTMITAVYASGVQNIYRSPSYACVQELQQQIVAVITRIERSPQLLEPEPEAQLPGVPAHFVIENIFYRFHLVARQLRRRHAERPTLDLADEYDVQDLMHALLRQHFDDVREEEWVPSYAGAASRTDFLIPSIRTIIEIKMTRPGLNAKTVGEQLIIDIARYSKHPDCEQLLCFVYDPEGRIANPAGVEGDLEEKSKTPAVKVFIRPQLH